MPRNQRDLKKRMRSTGLLGFRHDIQFCDTNFHNKIVCLTTLFTHIHILL